jgi:YegS/Rv2252/BmrU family lipid kinase
VFSEAGWGLDVAGTTRPGHAADLARAGVDDGVDLIAIYGGDGTTMIAVEGIIGSEVPVGLIPGGTGNLLAGNLRLPRSPVAAARAAIHGTPRGIDLGRIEREGAWRYFAVGAGTGFDAELMASTSADAKRRWGFAAYVTTGLSATRRLRVVPHRVVVDDVAHEMDAAMVLVANCGELAPPFLRLRSEIAPDDGWLDVVVAKASNLAESLEVVWWVLVGRSVASDRLWFARGQRVLVETEEPRPVQLDGELDAMTPFMAEVVPGALRVVAPGRGQDRRPER